MFKGSMPNYEAVSIKCNVNISFEEEDKDDDVQVAVFHQEHPEELERMLVPQQEHKETTQCHTVVDRKYSSFADYISKSPLIGGAASLRSLAFGKRSLSLGQKPVKNNTNKRHKTAGQHVLLLREEHVSLDELNPHPSCQTRKSSTTSAMINLVATVCGGGVLSLPLAFSKAGIIPTTLLMIYGATATDFALVCLVDAARKMGGRTYGDVAAAAFGSLAQVVTTLTIALMLCGTIIAYQVLVRDIWTPVVFFLIQQITTRGQLIQDDVGNSTNSTDSDNEGIMLSDAATVDVSTESANLLLACILIIALPLLWKNDLHALRHTCYVGFGSCVLLMIAVMYRAYEKIASGVLFTTTSDMGTTDEAMDDSISTSSLPSASRQQIKWWADDSSDIIFAFPIVVLCFFCSYNVLAVHSQLFNPTRQRIRFVLGLSMFLCWFLFFLVGLCGYLYTIDFVAGTPDNIMLAFDLSDKAILAGRMGFCLTLLFGLPLVMLPLRDAIISLPKQVKAWRQDADLISQYLMLNKTYKQTHSSDNINDSIRDLGAYPRSYSDGSLESSALLKHGTKKSFSRVLPHLVINGVDFDGAAPVLVSRDPEKRHGTAILYGSVDSVNKTATKNFLKESNPRVRDEIEAVYPTNNGDIRGFPKLQSVTPTTNSESASATITLSDGEDDEEQHDLFMNNDAFASRSDHAVPIETSAVELECPDWFESLQHGVVTLTLLVVTYSVAISVPGVAAVWSIIGSSMAIWIAFVVPTACFLRIRQHKGLTMQALHAWLLLGASLVAMVICTKGAIQNVIQASSN